MRRSGRPFAARAQRMPAAIKSHAKVTLSAARDSSCSAGVFGFGSGALGSGTKAWLQAMHSSIREAASGWQDSDAWHLGQTNLNSSTCPKRALLIFVFAFVYTLRGHLFQRGQVHGEAVQRQQPLSLPYSPQWHQAGMLTWSYQREHRQPWKSTPYRRRIPAVSCSRYVFQARILFTPRRTGIHMSKINGPSGLPKSPIPAVAPKNKVSTL